MNKYMLMSLLPTFLLTTSLSFAQERTGTDWEHGYIGTYTRNEGHVNGQAEGIYLIKRRPDNGAILVEKTVAELTNPSFVKLSNDRKFLYAVSELGPGDGASGFIHSYEVQPDNSLTEINKVSTVGYAPCHIAIDATGQYVFVANYAGGIMVMYERRADGGLEQKQVLEFPEPEKSNVHSFSLSDDNLHAYIADLGHDKIWIYDLDAEEGVLTPNSQAFVALEKGAGPRHFTFSKDGKSAYSINELNNTLSTFRVLLGGGLELLESVNSLPEDFEGTSHGADIHLHPSGNFLYASNRGHNSIVSFKVAPGTGKLQRIEFTETQGDFPRNFAISEDGRFLYVANQNTSTISSYKVDPNSGELAPLPELLEINTPVCIEFR